MFLLCTTFENSKFSSGRRGLAEEQPSQLSFLSSWNPAEQLHFQQEQNQERQQNGQKAQRLHQPISLPLVSPSIHSSHTHIKQKALLSSKQSLGHVVLKAPLAVSPDATPHSLLALGCRPPLSGRRPPSAIQIATSFNAQSLGLSAWCAYETTLAWHSLTSPFSAPTLSLTSYRTQLNAHLYPRPLHTCCC
jgi:hypothetical protein